MERHCVARASRCQWLASLTSSTEAINACLERSSLGRGEGPNAVFGRVRISVCEPTRTHARPRSNNSFGTVAFSTRVYGHIEGQRVVYEPGRYDLMRSAYVWHITRWFNKLCKSNYVHGSTLCGSTNDSPQHPEYVVVNRLRVLIQHFEMDTS